MVRNAASVVTTLAYIEDGGSGRRYRPANRNPQV